MTTLSKKIVNVLPSALKEVAKIIEKFDSEKVAESVKEATSLSGLMIGVFAQPIAESYLRKKASKTKAHKLKDFGFNIYLEASFENAYFVLNKVLQNENQVIDLKDASEVIQKIYKELITKLDTGDYILVFKPVYHPAIKFVREGYVTMLEELEISQNIINIFQKDFNDRIEKVIKIKFGKFYNAHLDDINKNWLKGTEITFLQDMIGLSKIGFKEDEDLEYQDTFASWENIENLIKKEYDNSDGEDKLNLTKIEELINQYFSFEKPEKHNEKICFIISDFGKGKSVFLRHYASRLAKLYLNNGSGYFPIYLNLREFGQFSKHQSRYGVIDDFLQMRYSIKISDEYFKQKEYVFLLDSLDESGEINIESIDKVIESIKFIQRVDPIKSFRNKIIISSRPFDEGLRKHITGSSPYITKDDERECYNYISIFGFRKKQFNDYLYGNLRDFDGLEKINTTGFAKEVVEAVLINKEIDIHKHLLENKTLSLTELRRPIFAYMIFQLIINNVDFASLGKIGVYLSFLNLLTKEAKHIDSNEVNVNLKEEFKYRNILHATASLWMYERQKGNQGILNKADICRTIKGERIDEDDNAVLKKFKEVNEIKFFSHSYFGVEGTKLHFQHQSFAEILLAEYYLKILIKYALDENEDWEDARIKLVLGEPTYQTVEFLIELLQLLKDCSTENINQEIIEKRKLLFPLLASCATKEYNTIFSNNLYYKWYSEINIKKGQRTIKQETLKKWVLNNEKVEKIIELCYKIVNSEKSIILTKSIPKSSLFNNEVSIVSSSNKPPDIEKWLALLVGNKLRNNIENRRFFNSELIKVECLVQMIKNWNFYSKSPSPYWGERFFFIGLNLSKLDGKKIIDLSNLNLRQLDFRYSYFKNTNFTESNLNGCNFQGCTFDNISAQMTKLRGVDFRNIKIIRHSTFNFSLSNIGQGVLLPMKLAYSVHSDFKSESNINNLGIGFFAYLGTPYCILEFNYKDDKHRDLEIKQLLNSIDGFIFHILKYELLTIDDLKKCFKIKHKKSRDKFFEILHDRINKYRFDI